MSINFRSFFNSLPKFQRQGGRFVNFHVLMQKLLEVKDEEFIAANITIHAGYIGQSKYGDLTDYYFSIRMVEKPQFEEFLSEISAGENIVEVDNPSYINKIRNCYLEIIKPAKDFPVSKVIDYLNFVKNSPELKMRVEHYIGGFSDKNLYFELYVQPVDSGGM